MEVFHIGFLPVRLLDLLDILLVAVILYKMYDILKGGVATRIFVGILSIYLLWWFFAKALHMQLLGTLLGLLINVGILGLIIVFQPEIRKFLIMIGTNSFLAKNLFTKYIFKINLNEGGKMELNFDPIVKACESLSKSKTGALIVITRSSDLKYYINTGESIDAEISASLLENIFFKNSPLHDGAIIIAGDKIKAARCLLPVTENANVPAHLGTRHRAAMGISEHTDALAIVVSEETGAITVADDGEFKKNLTVEELKKILEEIG
ncbi:MAG: diadenylate cyclase CdaA [Bacteroidia bacterium]